MPDRTTERYADIVIYDDADKKKPYIVVGCKKDGISDAEFEQAIKTGNRQRSRASRSACDLRCGYPLILKNLRLARP